MLIKYFRKKKKKNWREKNKKTKSWKLEIFFFSNTFEKYQI